MHRDRKEHQLQSTLLDWHWHWETKAKGANGIRYPVVIWSRISIFKKYYNNLKNRFINLKNHINKKINY